MVAQWEARVLLTPGWGRGEVEESEIADKRQGTGGSLEGVGDTGNPSPISICPNTSHPLSSSKATPSQELPALSDRALLCLVGQVNTPVSLYQADPNWEKDQVAFTVSAPIADAPQCLLRTAGPTTCLGFPPLLGVTSMSSWLGLRML